MHEERVVGSTGNHTNLRARGKIKLRIPQEMLVSEYLKARPKLFITYNWSTNAISPPSWKSVEKKLEYHPIPIIHM